MCWIKLCLSVSPPLLCRHRFRPIRWSTSALGWCWCSWTRSRFAPCSLACTRRSGHIKQSGKREVEAKENDIPNIKERTNHVHAHSHTNKLVGTTSKTNTSCSLNATALLCTTAAPVSPGVLPAWSARSELLAPISLCRFDQSIVVHACPCIVGETSTCRI